MSNTAIAPLGYQYPGFLGIGLAYPMQLDPTGSRPLIAVNNALVKASINQILNTDITERPFLSKNGVPFGTRIKRILFQDEDTALAIIQYEVQRALTLWEPRIVVQTVTGFAQQQSDGGALLAVNIAFYYRSTNRPDNMVIPLVGLNLVSGIVQPTPLPGPGAPFVPNNLGPPPVTGGPMVLVIGYEVGTTGGSSNDQVPVGGVIIRCSVRVDATYNSGAGIQVGIVGQPSLFMGTSQNNPQGAVGSTIPTFPTYTVTGSPVSILTTVTGATTGQAFIMIEYTNEPLT